MSSVSLSSPSSPFSFFPSTVEEQHEIEKLSLIIFTYLHPKEDALSPEVLLVLKNCFKKVQKEQEGSVKKITSLEPEKIMRGDLNRGSLDYPELSKLVEEGAISDYCLKIRENLETFKKWIFPELEIITKEKDSLIAQNFSEFLSDLEKESGSISHMKNPYLFHLKIITQSFIFFNNIEITQFNLLNNKYARHDNRSVFFKEMFTWSKAYRSKTPFYPEEMMQFIKESILNKKEDTLIAVVEKIGKERSRDSIYLIIVETLFKIKPDHIRIVGLIKKIKNNGDRNRALLLLEPQK